MKPSKAIYFSYRSHRRLSLRRWLGAGLALVGVLLAGYAGWGLVNRYRATHAPVTKALPPAAQTVTEPVGRPDETPIKSQASYQVPADQPRQIEVPSLNIQGFIQRVGRVSDGSMAVPTNIHLAGWYVEGPRPGEEGVAVLDGHLQGLYGPGIFAHLADVKPGAEINVEFGDGSRRYFKVSKVTTYVLAEASRHLFDRLPGVTSQLNLVTCAGDFDRGQGTFTQRVIVSAERIMKE